ncbi:dihydropteroate synthase [Escherichia coli]|nr:dihydropteroate synthase [Escherichia coli]EFK3513225.1 dihydropteroate synthase [Escherichia coli]EFK3591041.1 dihydropteroate synthase [Escherichia coli]EFK3591257.1 dihydropteroate synthase [Escherichia coli]
MVKPKNKHSLSHVRHDPAHCLAPGLFRALKRGERKRSKLDVTYDYGDGKRIEFSGPEPLGADDLRILQGLVAMAGPNGLVLGPEPKTEGGRQLRLFLEPKWEAVTADAMVVKGSYRALAKEIGAEVDSGGALKHIQDCIERLWKVSIIAQNGRKRQGFRLLSEYASDEADGRLYVALNPLIAQAVMGGGQHVRISMDEVRALDSETARLLHQRLCGWIDPGKTGKASIDTLCGYVWPSEASGSTMRKRRQRVREALPELVALKADGIPVSLDSYQPATQAYALSRGVAYLNDIRGFPDAAFYPQLAKSSAKLVVMHSVQDGQADRREAPAGDIMDHIAAFFDARIAALTGAGIKRNRLVLDPGMGFFLGAAPETSLSVLARFDELRLRFDLPVLLSVSRKSFLRALTGRGPGDVGAATLAAELAAAAGGADFIRTHEPRPLRDGLAVLAALKETARIR